MNFDGLLAATNVSASGLSAERLRMEVVASNIANAHATRSAKGGPYRRQEVVFATVLGQGLAARGLGKAGLAPGGVEVVGIQDDPSPFQRVHNPGHPDADASGFVSMPNVEVPVEMVNLITASRAYEANLRALQTFRQMAEQALALLRGQ
jgi:flagellar basal-body rod protein FlgC